MRNRALVGHMWILVSIVCFASGHWICGICALLMAGLT